jgi:hypothetical protein
MPAIRHRLVHTCAGDLASQRQLWRQHPIIWETVVRNLPPVLERLQEDVHA